MLKAGEQNPFCYHSPPHLCHGLTRRRYCIIKQNDAPQFRHGEKSKPPSVNHTTVLWPLWWKQPKGFFLFCFFFPALWSQKLLWCCRGGFHIAPHCTHTHSGAANNGAKVIRAKHGRSRRYCAATNRHSQSKISGVCAFAVFGGGPTFAVMSRMLRFLLLLLLLLMLSLLLFFFFFLWEWRVNDSPLRVVRVEEGGERAIKSLPEQPGMTHTTEFIRKRGRWGEGNREREKERERERERGQRRASWHLKIISGNKPRKRLWWSLTH